MVCILIQLLLATDQPAGAAIDHPEKVIDQYIAHRSVSNTTHNCVNHFALRREEREMQILSVIKLATPGLEPGVTALQLVQALYPGLQPSLTAAGMDILCAYLVMSNRNSSR